jgi:AraC family transcriptional regulator of adaptative response/methylated-DNA-[protein]-cysteine methyltransferase
MSISIKHINTPLGKMIAGATDEGVCLFDFEYRRMLQQIMNRIANTLKATMEEGEHPHFELLERQMDEYFTGSRRVFDLPLHLVGTPFQVQVWKALQDIPYGETRSYKQQSIYLNNEKAIRAVAGANGENGIAIVVPCHRVIGENGHLTGYGGGLQRKEWLLKHELKHSGRTNQLPLFA